MQRYFMRSELISKCNRNSSDMQMLERKLLKYASNYPTPVQQTLHSALLHKEQLRERRNPAEKEPGVK